MVFGICTAVAEITPFCTVGRSMGCSGALGKCLVTSRAVLVTNRFVTKFVQGAQNSILYAPGCSLAIFDWLHDFPHNWVPEKTGWLWKLAGNALVTNEKVWSRRFHDHWAVSLCLSWLVLCLFRFGRLCQVDGPFMVPFGRASDVM